MDCKHERVVHSSLILIRRAFGLASEEEKEGLGVIGDRTKMDTEEASGSGWYVAACNFLCSQFITP